MPAQSSSIAVVGVSAIFPGSVDATGFWHDILEARDLIRDVPTSHWLKEDYYDPDPAAPDKTYAFRGGFLDPVPFDPLEWGVPPSIVPATDTTQLLSLIVAKKVLQDATKGRWPEVDRERISCILGVTSGQELMGTMSNRLQHPVWANALRELGYAEPEVQKIVKRIGDHYVPWQESTFPGLLGNVVAGRIANRLDLGGTNCVTDAACASSFSAMAMSMNELILGHSDMVICGGVDTMNDIFMYMCFSKTPALSRSGECAPFSERSDGTLLGEGLAMVALRRLADAERDGDQIYAVIKGIGSSSDGRSKSVYAPVATGQAKALRRAYAEAGYAPSTVELVEAHGTGTKAGDMAEFEGLTLAFDEVQRPDRQWCALGTVKSQIGHTKAAAGAAGLFKAVMALQHKVLPPTLKIDRPNPKLAIEKSPFYLNTKSRPWVRASDHPRRAGVSSFGFGGSNFHVAIEEYRGTAKAARLRTLASELVTLSAATPAALAQEARALAAKCAKVGTYRFAAHTSNAAPPPAAHTARLAVVAESDRDLQAKLVALAERIEKSPAEAVLLPTGSYYRSGAPEDGKVAFVFPGQGSQYVNMGADLAMAFDAASDVWDRSADVAMGGTHLHEIVFPRPVFEPESEKKQEDKLRATEWAQPAIGAASLAILAVLDRVGVRPAMTGGHSFGEVTALHAAGALAADDVIRVGRKRGELMAAAASTPGAMTAVPRPIDEVRKHIEAVPGCSVANHNAPAQVVVSGPTPAIEALEKRLLAAGIEPKRLQVATAFHSSVVEGAVAPFSASLKDVSFQAPRLPVWQNATAAAYPTDAAKIRAGLGGAIAQPVRFVEQVESMWAAGARTFVEVGPHSVLTGLVSEVLHDKPHVAVSTDRRKKNGVTGLQLALGRLFVAGLPLNLAALWEGYRAPEDPASVPESKLAVHIDGANYGRPYPPANGAAGRAKPNAQRTGFALEASPPVVVEKIKEVRVPVAAVGSAPQQDGVAGLAARQPFVSGAPMSNPPTDPWILAFQEAQRATVEAHAAYQKAMADSHAHFLRTLEQSFAGLAGMVGGVAPAPQLRPPVPRPLPGPGAGPVPVPAAARRPVAARPAPAPAPAPVAAPPAGADVERLLLEVVAEKTGYPADMLGMHMALESDLGVDSIKRVEILSAVRERAPHLPEVDASEMAKLQTLGQVVDHLRAALPATAAPGTGTGTGTADVEKLLLEVVAEKTGYPADMLAMHMALESDLGVDSIKRVEILSAVRERAPHLPEVDASEMAKLQTLGQVVDHLRATLPSSAVPVPVPVPAAPRGAGGADVEKLLLEVVAEKTGYPADMLAMHMALESDLGVDSIKRVEILSAVRERAPHLPEVDAAEMAKLQTLGQVVDHLRATLPATAAAPAAPATGTGAGTADVEKLLLEVVAEKTGYPADMLAMHMALESDLGVDSIKRVEILSAVRERAPHLPEVDAAEMAKLQTLGQVVDHLRASVPGLASLSVEAPVTAVPPEPDPDGLGRWALEAVETLAIGLSLPGLSPTAKVAVSPNSPLSDAVAAALHAAGLPATVSDLPDPACDVLIATHGALDSDVDGALRDAFVAIKGVAATFAARGGLLVTVQDTGGDFGLSGSDRAEYGGLAGLAKTAAIEWPQAHVKAVDIDRRGRSDADAAKTLVYELLHGGPEIEVGWSGQRRITLRSVPRAARPGQNVVGQETVVVATGGARGVTAACLIALAQARGGRYALLGRTALVDEPASLASSRDDASLKRALLAEAQKSGQKPTPADINRKVAAVLAGREVRQTVQALIAAGAQARYLAVDVNDPAAVSAALADVRKQWGPIGVLVHGAGVLADKLIAEKTVESFDTVYRTKVQGLRALLSATAQDHLKGIVLFSSVAGRCGNRGQCDYAVANEVLAKVAAREVVRQPDAVVKALQWGPWEGGMVTPQLKAHFASMGVPMIPIRTGARWFVDELAESSGTEVVLGGEPRMEALASDGHPVRKLVLRTRVDRAAYPYLLDHVVAGTPVLPVVIALEWFARAANALRPDLSLREVRDVKVLRGIRLERFETDGDWFDVTAHEVANGHGSEIALTLTRPGQLAPHYSAKAILGDRATPPTAAPPVATEPFAGRIYDGDVLFHGAQFQVIDDAGMSDRGAVATIRSTHQADWAPESWRTDPAALDGGLQLALLWTQRMLGGASLPMGVSSLRTFRDGPPEGPVRAVLTGERRGADKTVTDIVFVDASGRVVNELRGVEAILRPPVTN